MDKYFSVFKISLAHEFAYKLNFLIWRFRNIIQILVFFFLWSSVDSTYFGYSQSEIFAYAFLLIIIRSIVMSTKANDVSGYVSSGELSNYLVKPINFFKYLLSKDLAVKMLNIAFSFFEVTILYLILKPNLFIQTNPIQLILFIISLIFAVFIFFSIIILSSSAPFWVPEIGWEYNFSLYRYL